MNTVLETIHKRKSMRSFTEREISPEDREAILAAAISAPSPGNQQLYTVIDVTDQALKDRLAKSCDNQPFIAEGKLVLIFCADCLKWYEAYMDTGCEPRKPGIGDVMLAVTDACIAAQTAVIAAESLGIGSCYIGDIIENCELQRQLLSLPPYVFPAAMLVFGYPTEQQQKREKPPRPETDRIVFRNAYPKLTAEDRKALFVHKSGQREYEEWMQAFCKRKYNSDFSREMTRSVREFLKDYE